MMGVPKDVHIGVCESVGVHTHMVRAHQVRGGLCSLTISRPPTTPLALYLARQPCSGHRQQIID